MKTLLEDALAHGGLLLVPSPAASQCACVDDVRAMCTQSRAVSLAVRASGRSPHPASEPASAPGAIAAQEDITFLLEHLMWS